MTTFNYDLVGKIGSMALIRKEDNDIDYNIMARLGSELKPGMIWVSSGATEIGRLDFIKRNGCELSGNLDEIKTDYAAQGQAILMENYRRFIHPAYSVRQVLVEHQHFNDPEKRAHLRNLLIRAKDQNAIPIINYNDPVSFTENRRMELMEFQKRSNEPVVECIDNDETASVITSIVSARTLVILSNVDGIYMKPDDPQTLVREIKAPSPDALARLIERHQQSCIGASRLGASGAHAKLEFIKRPAMEGTTVIIGHARQRLSDLIAGRVPCTVIGLYV
jgi:glutamate 5-kinase